MELFSGWYRRLMHTKLESSTQGGAYDQEWFVYLDRCGADGFTTAVATTVERQIIATKRRLESYRYRRASVF